MGMESTHRRDYAGIANGRAAELRAAIEGIINAANAHPEPIHYKVREAIQRAREAIVGGSKH